MSFEKFVPTIESKKILKERDKLLVYAANCDTSWEGEISKAGDTITVYVEGDVPIYVLESDGTYTANATDINGLKMTGNVAGKGKDVVQNGIPDPSTMEFGEIVLQVKKIAVFNVKVGDIDKKLSSKKDLMGIHRRAIGKKLALQEDQAIANTMFNFEKCNASKLATKDKVVLYETGSKITLKEDDTTNKLVNIFTFIDRVVQYFREANVTDNETIVAECSPKWERYLKAAMRAIDTDNSELIRGRKCPKYSNIRFEVTNNSYDKNGVEKLTFRTKKAVAFFDPFMHIEPYRIQNGFADCLKGYQIFDCGIVLPRELVVVTPTYA